MNKPQTTRATKNTSNKELPKTSSVQLHIGGLRDMGKRFIAAYTKAAAGKHVQETHITFMDLDTMLKTLSAKRLELLRHVHEHGAESIRAVAVALGRDYKNIHTDVKAMLDVGLLLQTDEGLCCPWGEVQASLVL